MNVLGLDTATAASVACVLRSDGGAFGLDPPYPDPDARPAHARELLPAVGAALAAAELEWTDLDAIAVGVGPGGYTGLRIGIATARALAQGLGLGLRPVSSLAALAAAIDAPLRLPVIDARRGEVFAALHRGAEELWPPAVLAPAELAERVASEVPAAVAGGDGALRFRQPLEAGRVAVAPDGSEAHVISALNVCRLGRSVPPVPPEAVVPHYLRAPDATPSR